MKKKTNRPPRIHRPLAEGVVATLFAIFNDNKHASHAIERTLKSNKKWGSRDRAFVAYHSYEIVRWWRRLTFMLGNKKPRTDEPYLWQVLGLWFLEDGLELPAWEEFKGIRSAGIKARRKEAENERAIWQSIPDWLDERGAAIFGKAWDNQLTTLNTPATVYLRVNTAKATSQTVIKALAEAEIVAEALPDQPNCLKILERKNLFTTDAFKQGFFEVQDKGSQLIAPFLEVAPGMRVIDACAGGGGKSLHLAGLMQNKGALISMDVYEWKLKELKKRARRNGLHNITTKLIDKPQVIKRLHGSADRLLLDVPCSGVGVLRRNPDAKWKLAPEFLEEVQALQADIFQRYARMLKPGGKMVYATCSILPEENEAQVQQFLKNNTDYQLEAEENIRPYEENSDGFYMARLVKG